MKNSKFLLLSFLFVQSSFLSLNAQGGDPPVPNFLFLFGQIEVSSGTTITHTLTALGTYWDLDLENEEFPISNNGDLEEAVAIINGSTTPEPSYNVSTAWKGFIFPWLGAPYQHTDDIAYGIYKVTNSYNNDYFYIDIRDCKYKGPTSFVSGIYNPDFFIRFNDEIDIFKWRAPGGDWTEISTGEVLNVWDIKNNGTVPTTSFFEDFWDNALVAVNDGNNHPNLVWGPYPDAGSLIGTITGYKIYRSASHNAGQPPINFSLIETVGSDEFEYVDDSVTMGGGYNAKSYYVTCIYEDSQEGGGETGSTNTVEVRLTIPHKRGATSNNLIYNFEYNLKQNYPNPFNPSTQIDYTINSAGFVTIKVYDMLSNEIASLVNERKQPGDYYTTFDAANLPSGIYIYRIVSDNFQATKKMILLK